jgi:serine/threonine protein kinase
MLGQGANGAVFLAQNETLQRTEAIKVWAKLRSKDNRDKLKQGLEEARKAASVAGEFFAQIYSGGTIEDKHFYVVMEYVDGPTLDSVLNSPAYQRRLNFNSRMNLAESYMKAIELTTKAVVMHGDAHTNNVLLSVSEPNDNDEPWLRDVKSRTLWFSMKLVDFGTSYNRSPRKFERRHWATVTETVRRILVNTGYDDIVTKHLDIALPHPDSRLVNFYPWAFTHIRKDAEQRQ